MTCGVYAIEHNVSGRKYVGSSKDIATRFRDHLRDLKKNKHHSDRLQNAWNKYGAEAFSFRILVECPESQLRAVEQEWINSHQRDELFNVSMFANRIDWNVDTRAKMSRVSIGRIMSETTRAKIGIAFKGKKLSQEHCDKMSFARLNMSLEKKQNLSNKLSQANTGKIHSQEVRNKMSVAKQGTTLSAETKERMRESQLIRWAKRKQFNVKE